MIWLKGCHRCRGDLFEAWDPHGDYVECLQCGYQLRPDEAAGLPRGYRRNRRLTLNGRPGRARARKETGQAVAP